MEDESTQEADPDLQAQIILLAASHHDLESLRPLLRTGSASVQDPETGLTPLHAAIAACEPSPSSRVARNGPSPNENLQNGHTNDASNGHEVDAEGSNIEAATKTLRLLLQNGAIWNDTDNNNETPGCLALRLGLKELYDIMVDAGVRAEMLLNRLDEYEQLAEGEEEEEEEEGADEAEEKRPDAEDVKDVDGSATQEANGHTETRGVNGTAIVPISRVGDTELNNDDYLQSSLRFQDGRILDGSNNGVMMAWESDVMKNTADLLVPKSGLRVLNIGHGMGIIDTFFQERSPSIHHIIEAHPAILSRMKKDGWCERPNVTIHNGRWQDVVPKIMEQGILFDAIYFDTFAEDYKALRDFFNDCILGLLDDGGKWGFFNGLGADRQICYDVYAKVVEMDLFEAGFDTEWETVPVPEMEKSEWEGVKRRYWTLSEYKLPICEFIG
ncbi:Arginine N-methyltransferase 2 [Mycoblastus sanguinarius]|nr:Arginine N-methyltransferase 2 [Mycoblastus sanguinarius]